MKARRPHVVVSESGGLRALHIGGTAVQSAMQLNDPYALALDYTRCMMAFLLFHAEPREALMIGLGGGSLAKFLHRELRHLRVRVVEIDTRVVAAGARALSPAAGRRAALGRGRLRRRSARARVLRPADCRRLPR
jgi:spermidine synthase